MRQSLEPLTVAREVADSLSMDSNVRSIVLVGSQSRGDAREYSDIDILVLLEVDRAPTQLYTSLPMRLNLPQVSLLPYSIAVFERRYAEGSLFVAHVLNEGTVLFDDGYFEDLRKKPFAVSRKDLLFQLQVLRQRLGLYDDMEMFGEAFIDPLSHMYSIAKNTAILSLAFRGQLIFSKHEALEKFAIANPKLRKDVREVAKLYGFALRWSKGANVKLPFQPYRCGTRVASYVRMLQRMMESVESDAIREN